MGPVPAGNEWKCKKENKKGRFKKKKMNDSDSSSYSKEEREILHKLGLPIYKGAEQKIPTQPPRHVRTPINLKASVRKPLHCSLRHVWSSSLSAVQMQVTV